MSDPTESDRAKLAGECDIDGCVKPDCVVRACEFEGCWLSSVLAQALAEGRRQMREEAAEIAWEAWIHGRGQASDRIRALPIKE